MRIVPVILTGGSGTRLWPLSREQYPKQLLKLIGEHTLLQATVLRLQGLRLEESDVLAAPILVGNEEYRFLLAEQLRQVGFERFPLILEPCGRNTAPALTLAALAAQQDGSDPVMVVMPADHVIQDEPAFHQAISSGIRLAETGKLVTFGIQPSAPETGYGYIRRGRDIDGYAYQVAQFVEKPDLATAEEYLESGQFLWNGGIFAITASVWLEKIEQCRPDISAACYESFANRQQDDDFTRPAANSFAACPSDSIDYAVMEKLASQQTNTGEVAVVPFAAKWSDVGAWNALWEISAKDDDGNLLTGDVIAVDSQNSMVLSDKRLVACVGLSDIIVVETADAVLVADKAHIQKVKDIVTRIKQAGRSEINAHRKINRPWGWYDSIDNGDRFQVKRIMVNPGASLSLQLHHHRAEHWVVVRGTAKVTRGEETYLVSENQSTFIPLGVTHRLENPGKLPLEIIEIQSGSYLSEDDIVRFEDIYGR